ncbi:hypothetical protein [Methanobrevibacter sp. V74]|uniref:hypothetical protein n=1 Tax=Methanobrevibacter sp. V74 TaxID=3064279 RepID=UPI0027323516|nr:hypothetical protein [Methanobrevibacter sp. V74]
MKNEILIAVLILIFTIGIVSGEDININSIKAPDSYKTIDDDTLESPLTNLHIDIDDFELESDDNDTDDKWYKNNTNCNYTVVNGTIHNTFNFTDEINQRYGCVELIKINGIPTTITVWGVEGTPDKIISNASECLEKVNELNSFEPIDPSSYK